MKMAGCRRNPKGWADWCRIAVSLVVAISLSLICLPSRSLRCSPLRPARSWEITGGTLNKKPLRIRRGFLLLAAVQPPAILPAGL